MARTYKRGYTARLVNAIFTRLTLLGLGARYRHILTVRGRKSGRLYSTPVDVIEEDGSRWLVAGYGPSAWVANVRAAGQVRLRRGRRSQTLLAEPVEAPDAVPVLRRYMTQIRVTRPYFDAAPESSDEEIAMELPRHAVFRLRQHPQV